jgi:phospholipid/cholesterol/gamma-HCH transport system substrate-binding protein
METRAHHVLIGAFTILVTLLAVLFALWAANYAANRDWDEYEVVFTEAVTGLGTGGIVQYNGINVGEVRRLSLDPKDPRKVIARIRLTAGTPVKIDTKAKLAFIGLTGVAQIQLSGGLPESPRLLPTEDRKVPVIPTEPSALQNIAEAASDIVERLRVVLSDQNLAKISDTLANLDTLSTGLANDKEGVAALLKDLRGVSAQLNVTLVKAQGSLDSIHSGVQDLPQVMKRLDRTLAQFESVGANADSLIAENRASIGGFTQDGLAQVGPTLAELRVLLQDLRKVVSGLDRNPGGYITGRNRPEEFKPK